MSMVAISIFNASNYLLSIKLNPGLILHIFNFVINSDKSRIISLSLLFLIFAVRMALQLYLVYIHDVDVFFFLM